MGSERSATSYMAVPREAAGLGTGNTPQNTSQTWRKLIFGEMKCVCVCVLWMMRYQNGEEERNSGTGHELYLKMSCPAESHVNGSQSSYDWEEKEIQGAKEGKNRWGN